MTLNFLMASHRSPDMATEAVVFAPRQEHGAPRMIQMVEKLGARLASELGFEGDDVGSDTIELEWASSSAFSAWAQSTVYAEASGAYHPSRPASFGPHISSEDGLSGRLVPASAVLKLSDNTCCPPSDENNDLASHPHTPVDWIALIQRGKCGFAEKIRKAQALGAIAVIVGDDADHGSMRGAMGLRQLIGMYSPEDTSDIQIPSVFVSHTSYNTLLEAFETRYEERHRVSQSSLDDIVGIRVTLSRDDVDALLEWFVPLPSDEGPLLSLTLNRDTSDVVLLLLFLPSFLTFFTLATHRWRHSRARRRERASPELVNSVPWVRWGEDGTEKSDPAATAKDTTSTDTTSPKASPDLEAAHAANLPFSWFSWLRRSTQTPNQTLESSLSLKHPAIPFSAISASKFFSSYKECAICLSEFSKGEAVRCLPCQHLLHAACVDPWLLQTKRCCPLCRLPVDAPSTSTAPAQSDTSSEQPIPITPSDNSTTTPVASSSSLRASTAPAELHRASERTPLLPDRSS